MSNDQHDPNGNRIRINAAQARAVSDLARAHKEEAADLIETHFGEMQTLMQQVGWPQPSVAGLNLAPDKTPATLATVKHGGCVQLPSSERERFEAWHREKFKTRWQTGAPTRDLHNGVYADNYGPAEQQERWELWQAAAALSAQPSPGGQDALAAIDRLLAHVESLGASQIHPDYVQDARTARAALAARQPVGEPVGFVSQDTLDRLPVESTGRIDFKACPGSGRTLPLYAAPPAQAVAADGFWLAVDEDGFVHFGQSTDDGNGGVGVRENVESRINDWLDNDGRSVDLVWAGSATAQAVDLGMAQEYQRWIDFYHAGNGGYDEFLRKCVLIDSQAVGNG